MSSLVQRRINVEDLRGAPDWVPILISPINLQSEDLVSFFSGRITIGDNVNGQVVTTSFTTPADYATGGFNSFQFAYTGKFQPKSCLIGQVTCTKPAEPILSATSLQWVYLNNTQPNTVKVTYVAGLKPSQTYSITILCL